MGAAALGGLGIPHGLQQSQVILLAPHEEGPSKVGGVVTPPGPWTTSGLLCCRFSQQDVPRQSFVGQSGYMAEPT